MVANITKNKVTGVTGLFCCFTDSWAHETSCLICPQVGTSLLWVVLASGLLFFFFFWINTVKFSGEVQSFFIFWTRWAVASHLFAWLSAQEASKVQALIWERYTRDHVPKSTQDQDHAKCWLTDLSRGAPEIERPILAQPSTSPLQTSQIYQQCKNLK